MEIYGLNKLIFCGFLYVEGNLTCRRDGLNISWPSHHVSFDLSLYSTSHVLQNDYDW